MNQPKVTLIAFEMVVEGRLSRIEFHRKEKIDDLLNADSETLGEWLRAVRDSFVSRHD